MADISYITLPDGTTYNLKDARIPDATSSDSGKIVTVDSTGAYILSGSSPTPPTGLASSVWLLNSTPADNWATSYTGSDIAIFPYNSNTAAATGAQLFANRVRNEAVSSISIDTTSFASYIDITFSNSSTQTAYSAGLWYQSDSSSRLFPNNDFEYFDVSNMGTTTACPVRILAFSGDFVTTDAFIESDFYVFLSQNATRLS